MIGLISLYKNMKMVPKSWRAYYQSWPGKDKIRVTQSKVLYYYQPCVSCLYHVSPTFWFVQCKQHKDNVVNFSCSPVLYFDTPLALLCFRYCQMKWFFHIFSSGRACWQSCLMAHCVAQISRPTTPRKRSASVAEAIQTLLQPRPTHPLQREQRDQCKLIMTFI